MLYLHLRNGTKTSFLLSEKPELTFDENKLRVVSASATVEYLLEDVAEYNFSEQVLNTVNDVEDDEVRLIYSRENGLTVLGCQNADIHIYDTSGRSLPFSSTTAGGATHIKPGNMPAGIYIVLINGKTFKFQTR